MNGVHRVGHAGHHPIDNSGFAVHIPPQRHGVLAVLPVKQIQTAEVDGFYQDNISVKSTLLIGNVDHVVHKCPQEIPLPKLYHLDRSVFLTGHALV